MLSQLRVYKLRRNPAGGRSWLWAASVVQKSDPLPHRAMGARIMGIETIGPLLRALREESGRSQSEQAADLSEKSGLPVDRHTVSRWEREERLLSPFWQSHTARSFGVPQEHLRRAVVAARQKRRLAATPVDEEFETVYRRTFLGATAIAAGAVTEPWGRLAAAIAGAPVDTRTARSLTRTTEQLYLAEHGIPARLMRPRVYAHLDTIISVLPRAGKHRQALLVAAGETAALAGWMTWDMRDEAGASRYYRVAADAGAEANHPPLTALALIYASYAAAHRGDSAKARSLLSTAQTHVKGPAYAAARAWAAAREAEESAAVGDQSSTVRSLDRAVTAYDYADPDQAQPWIRFLGPARLASMEANAYGRIGHVDVQDAAERTIGHLTGQDKANAVALADVATAYVRAGRIDQGAEVARRAAAEAQRGEVQLSRDRLTALHQLLAANDSSEARDLADELQTVLR
jgi:hypothetical protein